MGKFLLGLLTGVILVALFIVIGVFAVASLRTRTRPRRGRLDADSPPAGRRSRNAAGRFLVFDSSSCKPERPLRSRTSGACCAAPPPIPASKPLIFEPEGATPGWAKMQEIRADLEQFRKSGKPLIAYLKSPNAREYYMATACSKIYMSPVDVLDLKGVALELMYFKNTLDKLGVHVDVEHAGKYKDYGDMFTRSSMSPETNEVMSSLADEIYGDLVNTIARARGKDPAAVRAIIDNGPFIAKQAKANGLVDDLRYEDQILAGLHKSKPPSRNTSLRRRAGKDKIAFVVAEGTITRGGPVAFDGSTGLQSEAFDKMIARIANDSSVKGVIVRIDSPGGEDVASDEMLHGHAGSPSEETRRHLDVGRRSLRRILHGDDRRPVDRLPA